MEIDARFPTIQASQSTNVRVGETPVPPQAVPAGSGSEFYISPVLRFDSRSLTLIFQVRDSGSGDVVRQFPPETVVERYRQDPTVKPFVLSPASGDSDAVAEDLDTLVIGTGEGDLSEAAADNAAAGDASGPEPSGSRPVDLVA